MLARFVFLFCTLILGLATASADELYESKVQTTGKSLEKNFTFHPQLSRLEGAILSFDFKISPHWSLGVGFGFGLSRSTRDGPIFRGVDSNNVESNTQTVSSLRLQYYVAGVFKSGFYIAPQFDANWSSIEFDDGADQFESFARVGFSFGWNWFLRSGVNFQLGVGPTHVTKGIRQGAAPDSYIDLLVDVRLGYAF